MRNIRQEAYRVLHYKVYVGVFASEQAFVKCFVFYSEYCVKIPLIFS